MITLLLFFASFSTVFPSESFYSSELYNINNTHTLSGQLIQEIKTSNRVSEARSNRTRRAEHTAIRASAHLRCFVNETKFHLQSKKNSRLTVLFREGISSYGV